MMPHVPLRNWSALVIPQTRDPRGGYTGQRAQKLAEARIPTEFGNFVLHLYGDGTKENHVAFVLGDVAERENVLTRVHSECFTGEILGSLRCDCAVQLRLALQRIAQEGCGVLIYLRQEGRGIGLLNKLRAYNLQDLGHDTVDANLLLGRDSDERTYDLAALMLRDLGIRSVRLLTNNPSKVEGLRQLCTIVNAREPLIAPAHAENAGYLQTKVLRMRHEIDLSNGDSVGIAALNGHAPVPPDPVAGMAALSAGFSDRYGRPFTTLCYAQSLDGCLSSLPGKPLALSGAGTLALTHRLRASHDGVLVGIGTVLSDNPRLTVRYASGRNPQPIVLDSRLRIPLGCNLLRDPHRSLWVASSEGCPPPRRRRKLQEAGATVLDVSATGDGRVDLADLMPRLAKRGIRSLMVEGGVQVIRSLMAARLVDYLVVTVVPRFVGGRHRVRVQTELMEGPDLRGFLHSKIGEDLVLWGEPTWPGIGHNPISFGIVQESVASPGRNRPSPESG